MKKVLAFVLTMALVFSTFGSNTAFAADVRGSNGYTVMSTYGYVHTEGTMEGSRPVYSIPLDNVGMNPTFSFSISGNPDLYVDVKAVSPGGGKFTAFENIRCDGEVHKSFHLSLYQGTYQFTIQVNHGSSAGQVKPFSISATW